MAFSTITSTQIEIGKAVKKELFDKVKGNFDDHETRIAATETGAGVVEICNLEVLNASSAPSMTGLFYWKAPVAVSITKVELQIFEKGSISTGSVTIDVKKNTTPDDTGMTSIMTVLPTLDFSSCADYDANSGTLDASEQDIAEGEFLRFDVTALPALPLGKFRIICYASL